MHDINVEDRKNRKFKIYIEGEGTEEHKTDSTKGYAFGSGATGVTAKVSKAFQKIKAEIDYLKKKDFIKKDQFVNEIDLTVFGFS